MQFEELTLIPKSGEFDVELMRRRLAQIPSSAPDPVGGVVHIIAGYEERLQRVLAERERKPTEFPPIVALVHPSREKVVISLFGSGNARIHTREFIAWMFSEYSCRVLNEEGDDITAKINNDASIIE